MYLFMVFRKGTVESDDHKDADITVCTTLIESPDSAENSFFYTI